MLSRGGTGRGELFAARVILKDRFGIEDRLSDGVFPDKLCALSWVERELEYLRWNGVWEHEDECYVAKIITPNGRIRTAYLCDRGAAIDWDGVW